MIDEGENLKEIQEVLQEALKRVITPEYRKEVARYSVASTVESLKQLLEPAEHVPQSSAAIDYEKLTEIITQRYAALSEDERLVLKPFGATQGYSDTFEYYKAMTLQNMAKNQSENIQLKDTDKWLARQIKKQKEKGSIQ